MVCGIGFGHASRTHKLINRLSGMGHEVYIVASGDAIQYFRGAGVNNLFNIPGMMIKWSEVGLSPFYSFTHYIRRMRYYKAIIHIERRLIDRLKPDIIIIDSRPISQISTRIYRDIPKIVLTNQLSISSNNELINNLIIYKWFPKIWQYSDKIAILDLPPPYTITYRNIIGVLAKYPKYLTSKIMFTGPIIDLPKNNYISRSREWDIGFYISAPHYDKKVFSRDILRVVKNISSKYRVMVSLGDPNLRQIKINLKNLWVSGWIDDKYSFLGNVKIVVLRGGQTSIFESIYTSTPMLILPPVNQTEQIENANRIRQLGIGECVDYNVFKDDIKIFYDRIGYMLSNYQYYLDNLVNIRKQLIRYNGLDRLIDIILGMVG